MSVLAATIQREKTTFELSQELERVRDILIGHFDQTAGEIRIPITTLANSRAKLLRPALVLLSASLGTYNREKITHIAAAVEMFHMASLIHDDIVDGAKTRRGAPAVHVKAGDKSAVLIGDYLFSRSFSLAAEYSSIDNLKQIAEVVGRVCESEILETASRHTINRSVRTYLRHVTGKTAALFALSCYIGAKEADCDPQVCERARRAGYHIGMGFQIIDDILDLTSSEPIIGKPTGTDLREGVYTLPIIYALQRDDGRLQRALTHAPYTTRRVSRIMNLTNSLSGIELAREAAKRYTSRALTDIGKLPSAPARGELESIARELLVRRY